MFNKKLMLALLMLLLTAAPLCASTSPNLLENASFEEPSLNPSEWAVFGKIPGWTSTGAGIEIQNGTCGKAYDGLQFVELDSRSNSSMSQSFATVEGQQYLVSFAYSPRSGVSEQSNIIEVFFNDTLLASIKKDGVGQSGNVWSLYSFTVTGLADSSTLKFAAAGASDSYGGFIDGVSVSAVPLPGAVWLLGSGLLGLLGLRRKV